MVCRVKASIRVRSENREPFLCQNVQTLETIEKSALTVTRIVPDFAPGVFVMSDYLPKEVREGLELARKQSLRKKSRMRVRAGDEVFTILRHWDDGFALDVEDAPRLRGLVDLYDGARHLSQCLIVASEEEDGEMVFEYKRATAAVDHAPLDYAEADNRPVGLLTYRDTA